MSTGIDILKATEIAERYAKCLKTGDVGGLLELFADAAVLRDPADATPVQGRTAIEAYFLEGVSLIEDMQLTGPVRILNAGTRAAVPYHVTLLVDGSKRRLDSIDVFTFDNDGRIVEMLGFWGESNLSSPTDQASGGLSR